MDERTRIVQKHSENNLNCFGVVAYLVGLTEDLKSMGSEDFEGMIRNVPITKPRKGSVLLVKGGYDYSFHVGLVTDLDPLRITHYMPEPFDDDKEDTFYIGQSLEELKRLFSGRASFEFRTPQPI
jgi:hypothetical protein